MSKNKYEPQPDKTNKLTCAPSKDSDQPGHPPSLIRVFAVRVKKRWVLSYPLSTQQRLGSDWADAKADLSICWPHMSFCWFCHAVAHIKFVCVEILRPSQQLRSCRAGQLSINTVPGQA